MANMKLNLYILLLYVASGSALMGHPSMSCGYGPRGSLTAICVNVTSYYFKMTNYRFDYLDETLKCVNCSLKSLDQGTFDIPGNEIKTLDIRNSLVTKIWPKAFIGMIYMEKLLLSNNPIEVVYPAAFFGVRKVKFLDMESTVNHLEPKVFQELHLLEVLILSNNNLQEIKPGTFDGLHNLRILDLSQNQLSHINNTFEPLTELKILKLNDNRITKIHGDEFNSLKTLLLLNLKNNHLVNFTTNIRPHNTLRTINLANNRLDASSFKPGTFSNLHALEELDLVENNFLYIPVKLLQGLYRLRVLNLSQNKIATINTGSFAGLPHLRTLNLSSNIIKDLKVTGRFSLPNLIVLDLSRNEITEFDYMSLILRTPRLRSIDLQYNLLSCNIVSKLEVLFEHDAINFLVTDYHENNLCPKLSKEAAAELIQEKTEEIEYRMVNNSVLIWMFILMTLVILLVGILFYVQFFIVIRMGNHDSVRILRNLGLRRSANV